MTGNFQSAPAATKSPRFGFAPTLIFTLLVACLSVMPLSFPTTTSAAPPPPDVLKIRELAGVKVVNQSIQFPPKANQFNGKVVEVSGFMVPLGLGEGKIKRFVLIEVPLSCCFMDGPGIDGMIFVSLAPGKEMDYASDFPVAVTGKFEAGMVKNQYGQAESLYRLKDASVRKLVN